MKLYYVYIILCDDGTYYSGVTTNLKKRLTEHKTGKHSESYTYSGRPIKLKFYTEFTDINLVFAAEKQIKNCLKRKKKLS